MSVTTVTKRFRDGVATTRQLLHKHLQTNYWNRCALGLLAAAVLVAPLSALAQSTGGKFAGGVFVDALCDIFDLMQGDLGGLLAAAAGFVAILGGAFGSLRGAPAFIVVAGGAFTISSGVSLYFGTFQCTAPTAGITAPAARVSAPFEPGIPVTGDETARVHGSADENAGTAKSGSPEEQAALEEDSEDTESAGEFNSDPFDKF